MNHIAILMGMLVVIVICIYLLFQPVTDQISSISYQGLDIPAELIVVKIEDGEVVRNSIYESEWWDMDTTMTLGFCLSVSHALNRPVERTTNDTVSIYYCRVSSEYQSLISSQTENNIIESLTLENLSDR